jgi:cytochrome c oxidase assembly protein subunit 15
MGCPDWPRCFGQWVPPVHAGQLPPNYKEIYSDIRNKKNQRFAVYLDRLGFDDLASRLRADNGVLVEGEFNAVKTWTEYINRIVGVVIGMLIVVTAAYSLRFSATRSAWSFWALVCLATVIFQGWLGSVVVSTNLTPWTVTVHMLPALGIIAILSYLFVESRERGGAPASAPGIKTLVLATAGLLLIQIILGTQVREAVDRIAAASVGNSRSGWLNQAGTAFIIHRSFSWLPLLAALGLFFAMRRKGISRQGKYVWVMAAIAVATGAVLGYAGIPPAVQPLHLLAACGWFGALMALFFTLRQAPVRAE